MRTVRVGAWLVLGAVALTACSKSGSSAASPPANDQGSTAPATASASPSGSTTGANPTGDFCTELKAQQAGLAQMNQQFATMSQSPDLAAIHKQFDTLFAAMTESIGRVEATMTSAPAKVRAAVQVMNEFLGKLKTAIDGATSMNELGTSMNQVIRDKKVAAASRVLQAYTKSQCGTS